jgi:hypothetical protein
VEREQGEWKVGFQIRGGLSPLWAVDYSFEGYIILCSTNLKSTKAYFKVLFKTGSKITVERITSPRNRG